MMTSRRSPRSPHQWMLDLCSSKPARSGGVVRRKLRDIERYVGKQEFWRYLQRQGFHTVENAGQLVIFCNHKPVRMMVRTFSLKETDPEYFKNPGLSGH